LHTGQHSFWLTHQQGQQQQQHHHQHHITITINSKRNRLSGFVAQPIPLQAQDIGYGSTMYHTHASISIQHPPVNAALVELTLARQRPQLRPFHKLFQAHQHRT
jgi:hypothetical protein